MIKTSESSRQPKSSRNATRESDSADAADLDSMIYEFVSSESSEAAKSAPIPAPKVKKNLAYGEVKMPEAGQN